jgi:hypothetical protein
MDSKKEEALKLINQQLKAIKEEINAAWEPGEQVSLLIEDKDNSPVRSRKEDIEPKVRKLEMSSN